MESEFAKTAIIIKGEIILDEQRCVACGEICDDGFALGRLCYFCIESVVVKSVKEENNGLKMDVNMVFHLTKKLNQESSREDLDYAGSEKEAFKDGLYFAEKLIVEEYNKLHRNGGKGSR